jgi:hypothetical protein
LYRYTTVYWEGLARVTVVSEGDAGISESDESAKAASAAAAVRPFALAFECPPRGSTAGADTVGWNPAFENERAARLRTKGGGGGGGGGVMGDSGYALQVRTLGGMPSSEAAVGDAMDEAPLVCTQETWKSARRVCETPMVSDAAAGVIADWRRQRVAAAAAAGASGGGRGGGGGSGGRSGSGSSGVGSGTRGIDREPTLASVVEVLRTATALNGSGDVSAADCWLLLAVPGPGGPQFSLAEEENGARRNDGAAGGAAVGKQGVGGAGGAGGGGAAAAAAIAAVEVIDGDASERPADSPTAADDATSVPTTSAPASSASPSVAAAAAMGKQSAAAAAAAAARRRMTTWYFDTVTDGEVTAMRAASEAAARKCDEIGTVMADAENRLMKENARHPGGAVKVGFSVYS